MEILTNKRDTYLIVTMKLFSSQSSNTIRAILIEAHNCEANAMLDSFLTVNPDSLQLLDDDCVESELFAEDTYRHAPFPLSFSCNYSKLAILIQLLHF